MSSKPEEGREKETGGETETHSRGRGEESEGDSHQIHSPTSSYNGGYIHVSHVK